MAGKNNETNQQAEIRRLALKISKEQIAPYAAEIDRTEAFPWEAIRAIGEAELPGLVVAEKEGGTGEGRAALASVTQEFASACASTALIFTSHVILVKAIEIAGNDGIKRKWLPDLLKCRILGAFAVHEPDSGSNAGAIATKAAKDQNSYVVNGTKFFITSGGEADVYLVLVRTDPEKGPQGMTTLLVEKGTPGLSFGRVEEKMGLRGSSSKELVFSDCRVPIGNLIGDEGGGLQVLGKSLIGWGFYGAAAISVGIAKAALDKAVKHAGERTISGQPIGIHQSVQALIADMIIAAEASEAYLYRCANEADRVPGVFVLNGFKAKLCASEMALEVTNKAIQVLGGHGYFRDYVVERLFRDARGLTLHFKTTEWLKQDIAKAALNL